MSPRPTLELARGQRRAWVTRLLPALAAIAAVAILAAACDQASSPSASPAQTSSSPVASSSLAASSSPSALTASWVSPKADAIVDKYSLTLYAKVARVASKVVFTAAWSGHSKAVCTATKAAAAGIWSCKADLVKLGIPAGKLSLSFAANPTDGGSAVGGGTRSITWAVAPPAPTNVAYKETAIQPTGVDAPNASVKVSWKASMTAGVTIHVYAVTTCLAPATSTGKPCVTDGMTLPKSALKLLRDVPAAKGSTSWQYVHENIGGSLGVYGADFYYEGIILIAENSVGASRFVTVASSSSCYGCVY